MPSMSTCWPWLSLAGARRLSRPEPGDGLALRRLARAAGAAAAGGRRRPWDRSPSVTRWPSALPPSRSARSGW